MDLKVRHEESRDSGLFMHILVVHLSADALEVSSDLATVVSTLTPHSQLLESLNSMWFAILALLPLNPAYDSF